MRDYTVKILELVDAGVLDQRELIRELLMWLSESDVKEFYEKYVDFDEDED
jgi:hypothetical protein